MEESLPTSFETEEDLLLFQSTFQEVRVIKPRDFCNVLSNGETIGEFYRRTGKNQQNQEIYDKWISPVMISMCIRTLKKNPDVLRLPNGLTPTTFSIDHIMGRYTNKKAPPKKKNPAKRKKQKGAEQLSLPAIIPTPEEKKVSVENLMINEPAQTPTKTIHFNAISPQTSPSSKTDNLKIEYVFGLSNDS